MYLGPYKNRKYESPYRGLRVQWQLKTTPPGFLHKPSELHENFQPSSTGRISLQFILSVIRDQKFTQVRTIKASVGSQAHYYFQVGFILKYFSAATRRGTCLSSGRRGEVGLWNYF